MRECWLRPNRRVLLLAITLHLLIALVATTLATSLWLPRLSVVLKITFGIVAIWLWIRTAIWINHTYLPRLAYEQGELLFFLRSFRPLRVPVAEVECFFLGQTDSMLAASTTAKNSVGLSKTRAIVVRLAEAATPWHARDVRRELGHWSDGYITIRGTWCEPMNPELVKELNPRLVAIHRQQRKEAVSQ